MKMKMKMKTLEQLKEIEKEVTKLQTEISKIENESILPLKKRKSELLNLSFEDHIRLNVEFRSKI